MSGPSSEFSSIPSPAEALIKNPGVLCCGSVVADVLVCPVEEPGWGKTTWVETIELSLGGNGANTSYTLAKLGIPVRLLSAVGQDDFGGYVLNKLHSAGVDTSWLERSVAGPTATSAVLVHSDGKRALLHRPGASRQAFPSGITLTDELVEGCTHLHVANIFGMPAFQLHAPELLRQAQERGMRTSMDTAWDPQKLWIKTIGPCLPFTDLLFVNEDEAVQLTGSHEPDRSADILQRHGARNVVVKLGPKGCLATNGEDRFVSPAFPVAAIDTTGAGDCFAGGFVAALQRGFDFLSAARFANAVGALSVASLGAVTGIRTFDETTAFLNSEARPDA